MNFNYVEYVEYYQDRAGEWRWRRVIKHAGDTDILSESGEGYTKKSHMLMMAERLNPDVEIKERKEYVGRESHE